MNKDKTKRFMTGASGLLVSGLLVTAALGLWHGQDVKAGVLETGDRFLFGWYGLLFAAVLAALAVGGWLLLVKQWKLENTFFVTAMLFGLLYLFVLPPLSAPDEVSHYITAYRLSNSLLGQPATDEKGFVLIREEDVKIEDWYGELSAVQAGEADGLTVIGQTLTEETYREIYETGFLGEPGEGGTAVSNQWPVNTTPLAYVPQALGISLARVLQFGSLGLLYLGRFFNLLFYVTVTWLAMRRLPFGKEVLFGVSFLPMTLHLSGSMSYDIMILAMSFFITALCMELAFVKEKVTWKDLLLLMALVFVLGPCKMVYAPILGLCLLVPVKKFGNWRKWALSAAAVLAAFGIAMVLVNSQTIVMYATETESYVGWAEEAGYSFAELLHNPGRVLQLFYNTILWQAEHYHQTMIGAYLGNLDVVLDVPYLAVVIFTVCLILLSLRKPGEELILVKGKRLWIWFLCAACVGITMFSMLLAWTPVSSAVIKGVQGRYFLPILPVFLFTIKNNFIVLTKNRDRNLLFIMMVLNSYVVLRIFSIVSIRI